MKTIYKKLLFLFLILPFSAAFSQSSLSGTVVDATANQPLPGVNVIVQSASNSTTTDFDGKFQLNGLKNGDIVVFSYIGYQSETIKFSGQKEILVQLKEDSTQLQEVVVQVGYGAVRKKDATGSVSTVTAKDFNKGAIVSADQLLNGKVAGVRITSNGGQPDSAPNIRIRGGASLNASNSPLIVIDGVPLDVVNPAGVQNPLSLVNPNDIETFTVLKDASATAIYGSRASNGVIIITTKKGTTGGVLFNYSASVTAGKVGKKIGVMNSSQFVKFIEEFHPTYTNFLGVDDPNTAVTDDLNTPGVIEGRIISDTDWQDEIYRTSISTDHNLSARANIFGGVPFRASIGYNNTQGLVKTSDYTRTTASLKLTPTFWNDHLKVDINAKGIHARKNNIDEGGALGGAIAMDPTKPVYDNSADNRFGGYYQNLTLNNNRYLLDGQWNPVAILEQRTRPERVYRLLGNVEFDYKMHFLPELRFVNNLGLDASRVVISENYSDNSIATYRFNSLDNNPNTNYVFNPGRNYYEAQRITNTTWDSYLMYAKSLNGFLKKFDLQAGYSYQNFKNDGHKDIYQYNVDSGLRELQVNPLNLNNRYYNLLNLQSFFGRTNIDLANKYLLTVSFRTDGSSLFRKENRWGYFPAAALAWKLKEESFLSKVSSVNDLKIRLGWGKTGQQNIIDIVGYYPSTPLFTLGGSTSQYLSGINLYSANAYNPDLTWEKTTTYNAGIDFDLFKNSFITGSFDIYKRKTDDLLANVPLPPGQGLTSNFIKNVGSTESKGFELSLNVNPLQTDKMNLSINTNLAYNYAKVTDLNGLTQLTAGGGLGIGTGVGIGYHALGFQPYSAWVFQQLYDQNGAPIEGAFVDRNDDGQITNDDRYYKALRPNWTFGFGFTFNYGNWDLSSSFRGQFGGQVYNQSKMSFGWVDKALPNNTNSLTNVSTSAGTSNNYFQTIQGNTPYSDYFLEDATFVRCENIVLGYKFNKFINSSSLRVYGALNNPFIITKYTGQDPENFNSIDSNLYPRPRMYTFGLSLDF
ncbi:SusC/RagA family TonB-linked outer membrane protein [Flavobacterium capsici]|uniref:TonB-dependent receptor n=1 Tax=Flavobacterium capsici TaxID=3075618 RepID=A0AA96EZ69_9FLAO|nr:MULTISPECIES: TonB-dependent receptor [unclassified Flavobacterium]WNM19958.1 TonB-dependent receptor [Flavobacterium sp. PMR2A8]WNM21347.1 TonB-dependent receptor [Flavobacterium sp. PMTSA4]